MKPRVHMTLRVKENPNPRYESAAAALAANAKLIASLVQGGQALRSDQSQPTPRNLQHGEIEAKSA